MNRRAVLKLCGGLSSILATATFMQNSSAQTSSPQVTLLSAPLEVAGDWGGSSRGDAAVVISRMREAACRACGCFLTINQITYASTIRRQGRPISGYTKIIRRPHGLLLISLRGLGPSLPINLVTSSGT